MQGLNQTGGGDRSDQGVEVPSTDCNVDNGAQLSRRFLRRSFFLGWRQNHRVDHMDDAVAGLNVRHNHGRLVDGDHAVGNPYRDRRSLHSLRRHAVAQVARHDLAGNDVVEQDVGQSPCRVFQQRLNGPFGQRRKGRIGRRKDGEWPFPLQGLSQTGGGDRSDQGIEVPSTDGNVDNGAQLSRRFLRRSRFDRLCGNRYHRGTCRHGEGNNKQSCPQTHLLHGSSPE